MSTPPRDRVTMLPMKGELDARLAVDLVLDALKRQDDARRDAASASKTAGRAQLISGTEEPR
jgi:hypothetical protein